VLWKQFFEKMPKKARFYRTYVYNLPCFWLVFWLQLEVSFFIMFLLSFKQKIPEKPLKYAVCVCFVPSFGNKKTDRFSVGFFRLCGGS
jgi:hypothetical protein